MSSTEKSTSERSTVTRTFVIERTYAASPERVFAAWSDPATKAQWFGPYDMHLNEARISVSVATIEFEAVGDTTRLTLTEQGVFLDGLDEPAEREHGTNALLDALDGHLRSADDD